jgi:hypothetical protein
MTESYLEGRNVGPSDPPTGVERRLVVPGAPDSLSTEENDVGRSMPERLFAATHIAYELDAMVLGASRCVEIERCDGDGTERNINLEAALVHARALIEFLVRPPNKQGYMAPADFGLEWDTRRYAKLARQLQPLNVHLAHLTWGRLDPDAPAVSSNIVYEVLDAYCIFVAELEAAGRIGSMPIRNSLKNAAKGAERADGSGLVPMSFATTDMRSTAAGGRRPLDLGLDIDLGPTP